jgi:(E)-4-hydroxy-3-methylbut-2-enyl-diphosphate synthase
VGVAGGKGCGLIIRHGEVVRKVKEEDILPELRTEIMDVVREKENGRK